LALDHADLALDGSFLACVTGPSGSGKSTLLGIIAGLAAPTSGQVLLDGEDASTLPDKGLSLLRNTKIGCVPQGRSLLSNLSVIENVCLPFYLHKREGDPAPRAMELLRQMGVEGLAGRRPSELSGGEIRRVAIARGLINSPSLLIADEPTSDLDPENAAGVMDLFESVLERGASALIATHDKDCANRCGARFLMRDGRLRPS
jgi:putative ABC transport system ATP-binding protein